MNNSKNLYFRLLGYILLIAFILITLIFSAMIYNGYFALFFILFYGITLALYVHKKLFSKKTFIVAILIETILLLVLIFMPLPVCDWEPMKSRKSIACDCIGIKRGQEKNILWAGNCLGIRSVCYEYDKYYKEDGGSRKEIPCPMVTKNGMWFGF